MKILVRRILSCVCHSQMVCAASFLAQMPFHPAPISELSLTAASE